MNKTNYPDHPTANGYMTGSIMQKYIQSAIKSGMLPENAHRMPNVVSLDASNEVTQPIQFWQLYSVLGKDRIVQIIRHFYQSVFDDEGNFIEDLGEEKSFNL